MKIFFEKVRPHGLEVVAQQIAQTDLLLRSEILLALQDAPAGFFQQRLMAFLCHLAGLGGADVVQRLVHLGDHVDAVQDVQRLRTIVADHIQVGLPHIRAHELDLCSQFFSNEGEKLLEGFLGAFPADPQQADDALVDLVDQRQIFVAFGVLDFIHADGADRFQRAMLQTPADHILDGEAHLLPESVERLGGFLPGKLARPAGQKQPGPFQAEDHSLDKYSCPEWFRDAKFGLWAHWGPTSAIGVGDWYARNMYMQGSHQYEYHLKTYGHPSRFGYKDTIPLWKAERFDPKALARLYREAGAKYFVSMGVHCDNFDLWNSRNRRWNSVKMGPKRDIVGEWREAVRAEGLRFGVSEHVWGSYNWWETNKGADKQGPYAGVPYDGNDPANRDLY